MDNSSELKELMMSSFYKGNEKDYLKARERLIEELNYFKIDYELSNRVELRTRAYFAVHPLIPMHKKKVKSHLMEDHRRGYEISTREIRIIPQIYYRERKSVLR